MQTQPTLPTPAPTLPTPSAGCSDAVADLDAQRATIAKKLADAFAARGNRTLRHTEQQFMHGNLYDGPLAKPKVLWKSDKAPRKDHDTSSWLTATEYEDQPAVMKAKVAQLAELMRVSRRTVAYTGAGISASAVGQAALSGTNKVGWTGAGTAAQPTPTHHALARLGQSGWLHGWVQQNHDGLPQKAGFPQENICEVHGSWFDPSNPVVKYSGSLKDHEAEWMQREAEEADLVLVLGTSLGGLWADQTATDCNDRARAGASLGACIINLQQTEQDGGMSLRLSGKSDDVLKMLLAELGLPPLSSKLQAEAWPEVDCALVPYDASGRRLPEGSTAKRMWLDLRPGAKVRINPRHNHQNAKQPNTMHVGAKKGQKFHGKELANVGPGHGVVVRRDDEKSSFQLNIESAPMKLGLWWMEAAMRGGPAELPVVNLKPLYEDSPDPSGKKSGAAGKAPSTGKAPMAATRAAAANRAKPTGGGESGRSTATAASTARTSHGMSRA